jgi:hypothetical protein
MHSIKHLLLWWLSHLQVVLCWPSHSSMIIISRTRKCHFQNLLWHTFSLFLNVQFNLFSVLTVVNIQFMFINFEGSIGSFCYYWACNFYNRMKMSTVRVILFMIKGIWTMNLSISLSQMMSYHFLTLLDDFFSDLDCIAYWMGDKWVMNWIGCGRKEGSWLWPNFKIPSQHWPGGTEENFERSQWG